MATTNELKVANYLLAIQGFAMIRRYVDDPDGLDARAAEMELIIRGIETPPLSTMIPVNRHEVDAGYSLWAERYDGPNPAIETEEPVFRDLVGALRPGVALDAACGTGRHAAILAELGWEVIGVDATDAMLAEFGRVLGPGGHMITTDMHPFMTSNGGMAAFPTEDERPDVAAGDAMTLHYVPNLVHHVNEYVTAIRASGLDVIACHEPLATEQVVATFPTFAVFPDATRQAFLGLPYLLICEATKPTT